MNTIDQAKTNTMQVLIAVAKFESTFSISILAKTDVREANTADNRAKKNHVFLFFLHGVLYQSLNMFLLKLKRGR